LRPWPSRALRWWGWIWAFSTRDTALALSYLDEERGRASHGPKVNEVLDRLKSRLSGGRQLAAVLKESPIPMVLGYFLHMDLKEADYVEEHVRNRRRTVPLRSSIKLLNIPDGVQEDKLGLPEAYLVEPNLEQMNQAAELMGFYNLTADRDGLVRKSPMVIRHARPGQSQAPAGYDYYPSLALNMLRAYMGRQLLAESRQLSEVRSSLAEAADQGGLNRAQADNYNNQLNQAENQLKASWSRIAPSLEFSPFGVAGIKMGDLRLDTTDQGEMRLNLRGPTGAFKHISWVDIMQGKLEPGALKDKLVVVGGIAAGPTKGHATVFDPHMPRSELHATALDNLISRQWLRIPPWANRAELFLIIGLGLVAALIMPFCSAGWGFAYLLLLSGGLLGFAQFYAFSMQRWLLPVMYPLLTVICIYGAANLARHLLARKERRRTKNAFSQYVSDSVIERVLANPKELKLDAQRRELSIFFSDLRGFSEICEGLGPEELTALLNEYLSEMTAIILEEGGMVDKHQGDAIIAFWNAPLDQTDHAVRAMRAALRCQERLEELRPGIQQRTGAELYMRVGVNTGGAVVGNLGTDGHFDYSVMGDAARLAARLEQANRVFGSSILVSGRTWQQAGEEFQGRELGRLMVLDHSETITVYEPLALAGQDGQADHTDFARGLKLVQEGEPVKAIRVFENLQDDPAGAAYYAKLRELAKNGQGWSGIWVVGGE
jgi:class 3 adenylate cyclase